LAGSVETRVSNGARVSIVAAAFDGALLAAAIDEAAVHGAGVAIVTGQRAVADAGTGHARVRGRAVVLIITTVGIGGEDAT
jgi:hypothetical protein